MIISFCSEVKHFLFRGITLPIEQISSERRRRRLGKCSFAGKEVFPGDFLARKVMASAMVLSLIYDILAGNNDRNAIYAQSHINTDEVDKAKRE